MAVTKIHRTSRTTLIIGVVISIIVLGLFFLGGEAPASQKIAADMAQPKFTDLLLYWCYVLLAITIVVLVAFAIFDFAKKLKEAPKKALGGFVVLVALAALLFVTYTIGDSSLMNIPGYDGPDNVPGRLKMTDMWLYSCYFMLILTVLAIFFTPLLKRKK